MDGFNRRFQNPGIAKKGGEGRGLVSQFLQCQACYFVLCYTQEEYTTTPFSLGDIIDYYRPYPSLPISPNPPFAVYLCLPMNGLMIVETEWWILRFVTVVNKSTLPFIIYSKFRLSGQERFLNYGANIPCLCGD